LIRPGSDAPTRFLDEFTVNHPDQFVAELQDPVQFPVHGGELEGGLEEDVLNPHISYIAVAILSAKHHSLRMCRSINRLMSAG
jgi:hypothetical protein